MTQLGLRHWRTFQTDYLNPFFGGRPSGQDRARQAEEQQTEDRYYRTGRPVAEGETWVNAKELTGNCSKMMHPSSVARTMRLGYDLLVKNRTGCRTVQGKVRRRILLAQAIEVVWSKNEGSGIVKRGRTKLTLPLLTGECAVGC